MMRKLFFIIASFFLCTSLAFAENNEEDKNNDINVSFGFRSITEDEIIRYSSADKDGGAFLHIGYSRSLYRNLFIDFGVTGVGSGSSDEKDNIDGRINKTEWLIYVEPSIGLSYKYRYLFQLIVPFVEMGGSYARAQLKNNVSYDVSENGSGYGGYAGLGIGLTLSQFEFSIGTRYTYLPVKFNEDIKGNIAGTDIYVKASGFF